MAADYKSAQLTDIDAGTLLDANEYMVDKGDYVTFYGTLTLATQAKSKTIAMVRIPKGYTPSGMRLWSDTSLSSATIAIGNSSSAAKYRADGTYTTTTAKTELMLLAGYAPLSAEEEVWITNSGTATLPASGTLILEVDAVKP